jgi:hypothetical protein
VKSLGHLLSQRSRAHIPNGLQLNNSEYAVTDSGRLPGVSDPFTLFHPQADEPFRIFVHGDAVGDEIDFGINGPEAGIEHAFGAP